MAGIRTERPRGPLAVSHLRGSGKKRTACRYDFVYVSPHLSVEAVAYLHKQAQQAGSDHALVVAHLSDERGGFPLTRSGAAAASEPNPRPSP
jgi:endonuclease/exonuclease/phosphatase family metal-dependent hydrolase